MEVLLAIVSFVLVIAGLCVFSCVFSAPEPKKKSYCDMATERYVKSLIAAVADLHRFVSEAGCDERVQYVLDNVEGFDWMKDIENVRDSNRMLSVIVMLDLIRCHRKLGHGLGLAGTKEGLGLAVAATKFFRCGTNEIVMSDWLEKESREQLLPQMSGVVKGLDEVKISAEGYDGGLLFPFIFGRAVAVPQLVKPYARCVERWARLVAQADGRLSEREKEWLNELQKMVGEAPDGKPKPSQNDAKDPICALESLVGLRPVKAQIADLSNLLKIQRQRECRGLKVAPMSYHCVFTGNPGTGKTTVARILADVYREFGVLKKGHLVEIDRSGLVAEYVGQTAVKTNKVIDSALDGVLFVDEAYALVGGSANDYGSEAVATLLKRMEDDRDRLVVVLAGYSKEMAAFVASNPGLRSRFTRFIEFPDYSVEELELMFTDAARANQYVITDAGRTALRSVLVSAVGRKDRSFGNGRFVRNLLERTIEKQASRLASGVENTVEILQQLSSADIRRAGEEMSA